MNSPTQFSDISSNASALRVTCPICVTHRSSDTDYLLRSFTHRENIGIIGETIADALGYCTEHGSLLYSQTNLASIAIPIFRNAIARTIPLLADNRVYEERFQKIFFGAEHNCPLCRFEHNRIGRHACKMAKRIALPSDAASQNDFCFAHFQMMTKEIPHELRMPVLLKQLEQLDLVISGWGNAQIEPHQLLELVAGSLTVPPEPKNNVTYPDLEDALAFKDVCPLCVQMLRAEQRWIERVKLGGKFKEDSWLYFPTCPKHIRIITNLGDDDLTSAVVSYALHIDRWKVQQEIAALIKTNEVKPADIMSYRQRRRRHIKSLAPTPKRRKQEFLCQACTQLDIANQHAIVRLLALLREKQHRETYSNGFGLCMKHFAPAYLVARKGKTRALLAEVQRTRLLSLDDALANSAPRDHNQAREWKFAIARFSGFANGMWSPKLSTNEERRV